MQIVFQGLNGNVIKVLKINYLTVVNIYWNLL